MNLVLFFSCLFSLYYAKKKYVEYKYGRGETKNQRQFTQRITNKHYQWQASEYTKRQVKSLISQPGFKERNDQLRKRRNANISHFTNLADVTGAGLERLNRSGSNKENINTTF